MKLLGLSGAAVFALALFSASGAQATQTVCSAIWSPPDGTPGATKSAPIQGPNPPCSISSAVATVDVGTAGYLGFYDWSILLDQYPTTSKTAIGIGAGPLSTNDLKVVFDKPVQDPYFYLLALNSNETITFYNAFTILQSRGISVSGSTITGSGIGNTDVGFVAQFPGDYSQVNFNYNNNTSAWTDSFVFTTGGTTAVPGPLPILGVGAAMRLSRKLRRLSNQRRNLNADVG